jgi:hypothetical protein
VIEENKWPDHAPMSRWQDAPDVETSKAAPALVDHGFNHFRLMGQ